MKRIRLMFIAAFLLLVLIAEVTWLVKEIRGRKATAEAKPPPAPVLTNAAPFYGITLTRLPNGTIVASAN